MIGFTTAVSGPLAAILALAASVNLALALFNLIPGLPLDGGNILKAIVWKITGNPYKGVVFASRIGQAFGWLAIASGIIPLLLFGSFGNFWNLAEDHSIQGYIKQLEAIKKETLVSA